MVHLKAACWLSGGYCDAIRFQRAGMTRYLKLNPHDEIQLGKSNEVDCQYPLALRILGGNSFGSNICDPE